MASNPECPTCRHRKSSHEADGCHEYIVKDGRTVECHCTRKKSSI